MRIYLLLFFLIIAVTLAGSELLFYKEIVKFEVKYDTFQVTGEYFFKNDNSKPLSRKLFYPIIQRDDLILIDSIRVYDISKESRITVDKKSNKNGVFFTNKIPAQEVVTIKVIYSQRMKSLRAEYILTSTASWGIPLETANYELQLTSEFELSNVNYDITSFNFTEQGSIYFWERKNFFPEENFVIYLRKKSLNN